MWELCTNFIEICWILRQFATSPKSAQKSVILAQPPFNEEKFSIFYVKFFMHCAPHHPQQFPIFCVFIDGESELFNIWDFHSIQKDYYPNWLISTLLSLNIRIDENKQCFGSGQAQTGSRSVVFEKPDPDPESWVPNPDLSNVYFIYQFRLSMQLSYVDS